MSKSDYDNQKKVDELAKSIGNGSSLETIKGLVKNGTSVNRIVQNLENYTPLHTAANLGKTDIVEFLLQNKANPNVTESNIQTPLHLAAMNGHAKVVKLLLEYGADREAKDLHGSTPLRAAQVSFHSNSETKNILKGYDPIKRAVMIGGTTLFAAGIFALVMWQIKEQTDWLDKENVLISAILVAAVISLSLGVGIGFKASEVGPKVTQPKVVGNSKDTKIE